LSNHLREELVTYLVKHYPNALPHQRTQPLQKAQAKTEALS